MAFSSPGKKSFGGCRENKHEQKVTSGCRQEKDDVERIHQHYISKVSELHNVIADLSRKLEFQKSKIREEVESSHSEELLSYSSQCSSNNNNLDESCSGNEESTPDFSAEGEGFVMSSPKTYAKTSDLCTSKMLAKDSEDKFSKSRKATDEARDGAVNENILQLTQLHQEATTLRNENESLIRQNNLLEADLNKSKSSHTNLKDERDRLRRKVRELHGKLQTLSLQFGGSQESQTASPTKSHSSKVNSTGAADGSLNCKDDTLVTKIAEKIRLRRMEDGERNILGSEISSLGISSAKVAEHLVQHMKDESSTQEIFNVISSSGSQVSENVLKEFELETERLNSKIENIKSQNDLLALNLEESKCQCDRLSVLIGKYESNNTALQLALSYSDQTVEATEILLKLIETETALVVAKCHAAGLTSVTRGTNGEGSEREEAAAILKHSHENRKSIETVAKRMLQKLDRNFKSGITCNEKPWEVASSNGHSASTTSSSSSYDYELSKSDEQRLRNYVTRLKSERTLVRTTITELESVHIDPVTREPPSFSDAQKLDFENAVLMQELMALKEEKVELKAQVYMIEKEKTVLALKLDGRVAQEQAYLAHIEHLKHEVQDQEQSSEKPMNNTSWEWDQSHCMEQSDDLSQSLVEALHREKKLKSRIQELVTALDKVTRNSDLRQQQSIEIVNELKRGNSALIATFERSKKKYQNKIKKLEQQIANLSERNMSQALAFQQRVSVLEQQNSKQKYQTPSETSL